MAHAVNSSNHARITFSHSDNAKEIVFSSYEKLIRINDQLTKLRELSVYAANTNKTVDERYALNRQYQKKLLQLEKRINQNDGLLFPVNPLNDIHIEIVLSNQSLTFDLKNIDIKGLGIEDIDISSPTNAKIAYDALQLAIDKINNTLPSSTDLNDIAKFASNEGLAKTINFDNQIVLNHKMDVQKLLAALVKLRMAVYNSLTEMQRMAEVIMSANKTDDDSSQIIMEFLRAKINFQFISGRNDLMNNIKLFNNNELTLTLEGRTKHYTFPKLTLNKFNLIATSITEPTEAYITINRIDKTMNSIRSLVVRN